MTTQRKWPRAKPCKLTPADVKALVRYRDGYRCQECGVTNRQHFQKHGRSLEVHRLIPGSRYTINGTVTLCKACHATKPKSKAKEGSKSLQLILKGKDAEVLRQLAIADERQIVVLVCRALREYAHEHGHAWPS